MGSGPAFAFGDVVPVRTQPIFAPLRSDLRFFLLCCPHRRRNILRCICPLRGTIRIYPVPLERRDGLGPSSQAPLLRPGPLRTGRETFVLIRLKPFERLFRGDAALIKKAAGGEPCHGTLDEVERGFRHSLTHPAQEGRNGASAIL